ncbi:hypothetical protein [Lysinibacillus sp. NPDC086135]|uniref:hypothetical protein n=1 Tax=Lysinibacillus sp. NPDC086135 TaxID=3364130 RepID=UPI003826417C
MHTVSYTKEELRAILIQLGGRIDDLKGLQVKAGKNGDVSRVLELENFMKPILSGKEKMEIELYK